MSIIILILVAVILIFGVSSIRMQVISRPAFNYLKKALPPLSVTEKEAMEAGDIWWEGELFRGSPNWNQLHSYPKSVLSNEEQDFIDNQLQTVIKMIDDYDIVHNRNDLPKELWDYLKKEGFFALIIPKEYGGRNFSAYANSTIVSQIASRSVSAAVNVMVPNSLGPGELLTHYGTKEQKDRWLPGLAKGEEMPCFALTGPEAGSDAGSIPDTGVVCMGEFEGKECLGLKLTWDKRYITLSAVATVLGLAFKMRDPEHLLGEKEELGITCALIPTDYPGVEIGKRHNPLMLAFINGTTSGKDVFIPLDWIIGGPSFAGKGWGMLMECLSAGRGISLPALATAIGHLATKTTTAYAYVRKQFNTSIAHFEGVQEPLARIIANTYVLEASRRLTTTGIDLKVKPSVVTAIAKYHMTELGRSIINDAMDIHGGRGIQLGPKNYLGHAFIGNPISITVEGANILTRNLMIFGQGATRCHPYVLAEMNAAEDRNKGLERFDVLLMKHFIYSGKNAVSAFVNALTCSTLVKTPVGGPTKKYYQYMSRLSAALAFTTDVSMLCLGGNLKRKEMISARLGDVLSQLYLASAVVKYYQDNGSQQEELPIVRYSLDMRLYLAAKALNEVFANFPIRPVGWLLKLLVYPLGNHFNHPVDKDAQKIVESFLAPSAMRNRLTALCPDIEGDKTGIGEVENAFKEAYACRELYSKIRSAQKTGILPMNISNKELYDIALKSSLVDKEEHKKLQHAEELRYAAIQVDVSDNVYAKKKK